MLHVLYVDESYISSKITTRMLKDYCRITLVEEIHEVKLNLYSTSFDAIIICNDEMNDDTLVYVDSLRKPGSPMRDKPIILITANFSVNLQYRAVRNGVNVVLPKPIKQDQLINTLLEQVKNPSFSDVYRDHCDVQCVHWSKGGLYYCFSPDLNRVVSGSSYKDAQSQMDMLFRQHYFEFTESRFGEARLRISTQRVDFTDWKDDEILSIHQGDASAIIPAQVIENEEESSES